MCPGVKAACIVEYEDTAVVTLSGVQLEVRKRIMVNGQNGENILSAGALRNLPSFGGNPDVMRTLQTMPLVATSADISSGISVMGSSSHNNYYSLDNCRVISPYRFFGIFSVFNPSHFTNFHFSTISDKSSSQCYIGAFVDASTSSYCPKQFNGTATLGLINSLASISLPVGNTGKTWMRMSGRISYIDRIYPNLLKFGHASLFYGFGDFNLTIGHRCSNDGILKFNMFYSNDRMRIRDTLYDLRGIMAWSNGLFGMTYADKYQSHSLNYSSFRNKFDLNEGVARLILPSHLNEYGYDGKIRLADFNIGANVIYRDVLRQYNDKSDLAKSNFKKDAFEMSLSGDYLNNISRFEIGAGLRMTYYYTPGFSRVYPQPGISAGYNFCHNSKLVLSMLKRVQFSHFVEESNAGLPCNFWINADRRFCPRESWTVSLKYEERINILPFDWSITAFWRDLANITEFSGNILNIVNSGYEPLNDLCVGNGHSYGISVMLSAAVGKFDGWMTYNLSRSELKIPALRSGWFPASFDRTHDLKLNLLYRLSDSWSVSSSVAYATGLPFTKAEYGYMLGENLLCHYYPHNSSRLPVYFRLDLGACWRFFKKDRRSHRLDFSVLNATCHKNVLMMNYHYSGKDGFSLIKSALAYPIPSISYTIDF